MEEMVFCYWLDGFLQGGEQAETPEGLDKIKKLLNTVFIHEIDPSYGDEQTQEVLNNIHNTDLPPGVVAKC